MKTYFYINKVHPNSRAVTVAKFDNASDARKELEMYKNLTGQWIYSIATRPANEYKI